MRHLPLLTVTVLCLSACAERAATGNPACSGVAAGQLVITEIFGDFVGLEGPSPDEGQEWFELYNPTTMPISLTGLTLTHKRPDGSRLKSTTLTGGELAPQGYAVFSSADALPSYASHSYGKSLGEFFNTGGGQLAVSCGLELVDAAAYGDFRPGRAQQFGGTLPSAEFDNDDAAQWCISDEVYFVPGNTGTPGAANSCVAVAPGQCLDAQTGAPRPIVTPQPGELIITEIMPSPSTVSDTVGEWVEVYANATVDLNDLGLDRAMDSAAATVIRAADCKRVTQGSYIVFARTADPSVNGGLDAVAATFTASLVTGSASNPGDFRILAGDTVIDAVTWQGSKAGVALALADTQTSAAANDLASNFCEATQAFGAGADMGSPGAANASCEALDVVTCLDGNTTRPRRAPTPGQLLITEVMASPAGNDAQEEWLEVTNISDQAVDLQGLTLSRKTGAGAATLSASACASLAPGQAALWAHGATNNGGLPRVDAIFGFALPVPGDVQLRLGNKVIDDFAWTSAANGKSLALDPSKFDSSVAKQATSYCLGTQAYGDGSNLGTPGLPNLACP